MSTSDARPSNNLASDIAPSNTTVLNDSLSTEPARPADLEVITRMLRDAGLPTDGVEDLIDRFIVVRRTTNDGTTVVAAGAVEPCGREGLLRSVVVLPDVRGRGLGRLITDSLIGAARARGVTALNLLTETAESFFSRTGFETIERASAPESIRSTEEFRRLCSESAVLMRHPLLG